MTFAIMTLLTAIGISAVAAYYSIVGLMAIFSASAMSIAIMGVVLEIGKLVTASWLYQNWKRVPFLLKSYLTVAVVVLMFITSMGIFGYLSKAHIDQGKGVAEIYIKVERVDNRIETQRNRIARYEKQLTNLDTALNRYLDLGAVSKGLAKREEQEPERRELVSLINESQENIDDLLTERAEYQSQINSFEVEIGPIKYISAIIYGDEALDYIDTAVRAVILTLVFVFDPLAVLLLISANMSMRDYNEQKRKILNRRKKELEEENKGKVQTIVRKDPNGMNKVTKTQGNVSMEYYE
tara:strand:- start:4190 stop:5077 length:888 start_codon:yes stop_codon:yes gene_type:complete